MPLPLDFSDDPAVFDETEAVTLRARGKVTGAIIVGALRRADKRQEAEPSEGTCLASDLRWHIPTSQVDDEPLPGATIVDSHGEIWTVLSVERQTLGTRYVCQSRNLAIAGGLNEYVTLERATWSLDVHGAPLATWHVAGPALRARLQPLDARSTTQHDQPSLRRRYRIYLAQSITLDASTRLVHDDIRYHITNYDRPERIDALFVVEAEEEGTTNVQ